MIDLRFEDNGTDHDDLVLALGQQRRRCDSYYLAMERGVQASEDNPDRVRGSLRALLGQWLVAIEQARPTDLLYLPFELADESSGWVRCRFTPQDVTLDAGTSRIEGWSILPSDIAERLRAVDDFAVLPGWTPVRIPRAALVQAVRVNIARYGAKQAAPGRMPPPPRPV